MCTEISCCANREIFLLRNWSLAVNMLSIVISAYTINSSALPFCWKDLVTVKNVGLLYIPEKYIHNKGEMFIKAKSNKPLDSQ